MAAARSARLAGCSAVKDAVGPGSAAAEAEVIGGGTTAASRSEPLVTPEVGAVRTSGPLRAGAPLPTLWLVVQPKAASDAASETASSGAVALRFCKF